MHEVHMKNNGRLAARKSLHGCIVKLERAPARELASNADG